MATANPSDVPTGPLGLRLSSLVRAAGTTATLLSGKSPGLVRASLFAGGAHLAAREIDPAGLQVVSVAPGGTVNVLSGGSGRSPDGQSDAVQVATSTASWVVANLLLARLVRVLPWSRPISALLLGAGVYVLDDFMTDLVEKTLAARVERDAEPF